MSWGQASVARRDCRRLLGSAEHNHTIVKLLKKPTALPSNDSTDGARRSVHSASTIGQIVVMGFREIDWNRQTILKPANTTRSMFRQSLFCDFRIGANRDGLIGEGD